MTGWIKLHREITEWEWYDDYPCFKLFTHLLLTCNYKPSKYQGYDIPIGAKACGYPKLSEQTGLTIQQLRTAIKKLKSTNEVTVKITPKFSIISITKWDKYQESNSQSTGEQQASNRRATTSKEGKKERREETIYRFEEFWEIFPRQRRGSRDKAQAKYKQVIENKKATEEEIISGTRNYASSDEVARGFAKGAAAWLNDDRWKNDYGRKPQSGKGNGHSVDEVYRMSMEDRTF